MTKLNSTYDDSFYNNQVEGSLRSANKLLAIVYNIFIPESVLDIGCGRGAWLATCEKLGSIKLTGIDGPWVLVDKLLSKNIVFHEKNFEDDLNVNSKFDLAISLEVAEHISEKYSQQFVSTLCNSSELIIFGAATPNQGGDHHINEQPQSYWISLFNDEGYDCFDIFRGALWEDTNVEWWYKQNTFLFVKRNSENQKISFDVLRKLETMPVNITHPQNLQSKCFQINEHEKMMKSPTLKFIIKITYNYIKGKILFKS